MNSLEFENAAEACACILRDVASRDENTTDSLITYGQLSSALRERGFQVPPHEGPMPHLLGIVSRRGHAAGTGMLSALVVQAGTMMPGHGFFQLARQPPFTRTGDDVTLWLYECRRVRTEVTRSDPRT